MKTIYEARDGKLFETKEECKQYEFELDYKDILPFFENDDIRVWSSTCEKMNLREFLKKGDLESFFDRISYIDFKTERARFSLEEYVNKYEIYLDVNYTFPFKFVDLYYWDETEETWCALSHLESFVNSLKKMHYAPSN